MWYEIVVWTLGIVYILVVTGSIVVVILENRQPVKTMAWVMVLLAFPVVGLAIFYFFGQDFRKERIISRKSLSLLTRKSLKTHANGIPSEVPPRFEHLIRYFECENLALPYTGNMVHMYTSGAQFLAALLQDLSAATRHIHLESYIFEDDETGQKVSKALKEAAKRGVEVRVIYDDVGCWNVKKTFFDEMERSGIQVVSFLPVRFPQFTRKVNFRNHRKICVIDGCTGYVGGMNIADRYTSPLWKDMHLRLEGNAVYGLQQTFLFDWFFMTRILINDPVYYPSLKSTTHALQPLPIQIVTSSPASRWPDIMNGYVWAIQNARHYIYLSTPYFMPTEAVLHALQMAAVSGVDVRLMVTESPDGRWVRKANESYYTDVLEAGIKLYRYGPGFHHSKYIVMDDCMTAVGSANIDFRSFENNFEVQAFLYDTQAALTVKEEFLKDLKSCQSVNKEVWKQRSRRQKFCESFVRIFSPLL